jgi:hypothetical protein
MVYVTYYIIFQSIYILNLNFFIQGRVPLAFNVILNGAVNFKRLGNTALDIYTESPGSTRGRPICHFVGFVVLKAMVKMTSVFANITPCSMVKVNRCFGETYRIHLKGRRKSSETRLIFVGPLVHTPLFS